MSRPLFLLLTILILYGSRIAASQSVAPSRQASLPETGELYTPLSFPIAIDPSAYRNPFDSADIELIGIFESPSGEQVIVPGFWMQPYTNDCVAPCSGYDLTSEGDPVWQVRFTPQEVGRWTYTLQVRDNGAITAVEDGAFTVDSSDRPGFIHKAPNGHYFEYSTGDSYFPIGNNLGWSWEDIGGLDTYLGWLKDLSEAGGNYARLYIDVPWFISLEWTGSAGDYRTSQRAAAELDVILEKAEQYGIRLQLVLLWHQALRTYTGVPVVLPEGLPRPDVSADWDNNPYNVLNGGILSGPSVFLFDEQAQALFRRRLRYIVARWGYSPDVFAWEIVDQLDRVANYDPTVAKSWLQSTASYLRQIDAQGHLITASSREYDPVTADNPLLDFSSAQFYQRRPIESVGDQVLNVADTIQDYREFGYGPVILADYSLNPWYEPTADDPTGVHFQNSLWSAVFAGAAGGAMSDWWDTYVIPQDLMRYYRPLAAFAVGVDWAKLELEPAQAGLLADAVSSYQPVRLSDFRRQFAARPESVVTRTITADGVFPDISDVPSFLYGQVYNTQFSQAQRYRVTLPIDTYLEVGIRSVSSQAGARLVVQVDNVNVVEVDLRAGNRDVKVRVPIAAGDHTITLDNLGSDWLELEAIEIGQLIAPARSLTLRDAQAGVALAWLQHRDYTWDKVAAGIGTEPISLEYRLGGMPVGRYVAEIWDPLSGAVLGDELLRVREDGLLTLRLLPLTRQLAVRAMRQPDSLTSTPVTSPSAAATEPPTSTRHAASATPTASETVIATGTIPASETPSPTSSSTARATTRLTRTPTVRSTSLATLIPFVASTNTPRPEPTVTPR